MMGRMKRTYEQITEDLKHLKLKPEDMTCFNCDQNLVCRFRFDLYNQNGDCLAGK